MENMTYQQAASRLDEIVKQIEAGALGIDDLSAMVKEAGELVKFCKEKLQTADESIAKMLDEIG